MQKASETDGNFNSRRRAWYIFVCSFLLVKYWNQYYTDPCHFVLLAVLEVSPELRKYSA